MANVFRFRGGNLVWSQGSVEIQISRGWEHLDAPVEIILDELDFEMAERGGDNPGERRIRSGDTAQLRADIAAERWNYIGKVEAQAVRQQGNAYFFEPEGIARGLPPSTSIRQPVPIQTDRAHGTGTRGPPGIYISGSRAMRTPLRSCCQDQSRQRHTTGSVRRPVHDVLCAGPSCHAPIYGDSAALLPE